MRDSDRPLPKTRRAALCENCWLEGRACDSCLVPPPEPGEPGRDDAAPLDTPDPEVRASSR
jgi:hypothetical protein